MSVDIAAADRSQLELIYYFTYFSTIVPSNICVFLSCKPFVVNATFSSGLVGVEVSTETPTQDLKNIGKTSDKQKANPNSLNMSLRKDMFKEIGFAF